MTIAIAHHRHTVARGSVGSLDALVDAIGHERFGLALARFLCNVCGAERFYGFRFGSDDLSSVVAGCVQPGKTAVDSIERYLNEELWQRDRALDEAQRLACSGASSVVHADLYDQSCRDLSVRVFPQIRDRVVLCGRSTGAWFGLSILRTQPQVPFSGDDVRKLREVANLVVASLAKHAAMVKVPCMAQPFAVLSTIESCIAATGELPRREAEVCARILYGMVSAGIAVDLAVSDETVKTYRKRAYQRLSIGSERELLNWYLQRWSHWKDWSIETVTLSDGPTGLGGSGKWSELT